MKYQIIKQISIPSVHFLLLFLNKSSNLYIRAARKLDKQYSKSSVNISLTCTLSAHERSSGQAAFVLTECTLDGQLVPVCGQ